MLEKFTIQKQEMVNNINKILDNLENINNKLKEIEEDKDEDKNQNENIDNLIVLKKRFQSLKEKVKKEKITISVMATVSNGKSTFLNALIFGQPILQAQSGETTATLFEIRYGEKYKINEKILSSLDELKEEIKTINKETLEKINNQEQLDYKKIVIEIPFEKLKDIILLDTPGYGSINEYIMMKILYDASRQSDVIVLLLDISKGLQKNDKEFLEQIKKNNLIDKTFIILNKLDGIIDEDEKELKTEEEIKKEIKNVIETTKKEINKIISTDYIYIISAKKALVGKLKQDKKRIKESQFDKFEKEFWDGVIKLKNEKFKNAINYFNILKLEFCNGINKKYKYLENNIHNIKELVKICPNIKLNMELDVLKNKKKLLENIDFNFKFDTKKLKKDALELLDSNLRYRLKKVGFIDSFSEEAWNEAINQGLRDFEKEFGELFIKNYLTPYLLSIQENIETTNRIISEINSVIKNINNIANSDIKLIDEIKKDFEISADGKIEYASDEFVNLLEDLGITVVAGATGAGIGIALELLAGRFLSFTIPGIGWILGIITAAYTIFKQSNKSEEILEKVMDKLEPQVLEKINEIKNTIYQELLESLNFSYQINIQNIENTINQISEILEAKQEEKNKYLEKLQKLEKIKNYIKQTSKEICN